MRRVTGARIEPLRGVIVLSAVVGVVLAILWIIGMTSTRTRHAGVLFIGSSTIARFPLAVAFPRAHTTNMGVGNEDAVALRERIPGVLPEGTEGVVLYAGSADMRFDPLLAAPEIRERVEAVVDALRAAAPRVPIVMIEVLPARRQHASERAALADLNEALADLAASRGLAFVRTNRAPLVDLNGDLDEAVSVDRHHLSEEGYRTLAQWIIEDGGVVGRILAGARE